MKITYEFNTDDENFSQDELLRVQKADDMAGCIWDILQQVRQWYKYSGKNEISVEEIQDSIYDIIDDRNINIDKLYP